MSLSLFAHPLSSYSQKVLVALYENDTPFSYRMLGPDHPDNGAEVARLWPLAKFPLLLDGGHPVVESSIIVEHLQIHHPGPVRLVPEDRGAALEVRMLDRIFDNHVMANMQRIVNDALRPPARRDPVDVEQARAALDKAYAWLDATLAGREWAAGPFSLADCAAAPSLFYADWVHPIGARFPVLSAYRARLLARPSSARWTRAGPTAPCSRRVRPIATDRRQGGGEETRRTGLRVVQAASLGSKVIATPLMQ